MSGSLSTNISNLEGLRRGAPAHEPTTPLTMAISPNWSFSLKHTLSVSTIFMLIPTLLTHRFYSISCLGDKRERERLGGWLVLYIYGEIKRERLLGIRWVVFTCKGINSLLIPRLLVIVGGKSIHDISKILLYAETIYFIPYSD